MLALHDLSAAPSPAEELYAQLRRALREEALRPGDALTALSLAADTRLSRVTVTRALDRLVTEGVLSVRRGRGYQVVNPAAFPLGRSLVSMSAVAREAGRRLVSVYDPKVGGAPVEPPDVRLVGPATTTFRWARGFEDRNGGGCRWALFSTVWLAAELRAVEAALSDALVPWDAWRPGNRGQFSVHAFLQATGRALAHSEVLLGHAAALPVELAPMARALLGELPPLWQTMETSTYAEGEGPVHHTRTWIVPGTLRFNLSNFGISVQTCGTEPW